MVAHPRLENVIGWLLHAVVGSVSGTATDTPESGMNRHVFAPPADPASFPWMALRSYTPGATAADAIGNEVRDARCVGMQLGLRAGQLVNSTFSFIGREPRLQESTDLSSWTWDAACETYPSAPLVSATGCAFNIGGSAQKATQAQVTIANQYTSPQEEMIIGSPHPDDFIVRRQSLSFMWLYKWQDHALYQSLVTGTNTVASNYIAWSPVPHSTSAELIVVSPGNVSGMANPYRLRIYAPEVVWQTDGAPELVGDGWLQLRLTGLAQDQTSGATFQVDLDNEVASGGYAWPT
jgi:hypothetical protein